jgi:hypothetical protein
MAQQLTKKAKINAEKARISQLTSQHSEYFKLIISHQIENRYCFGSIHKRNGSRIDNDAKLILYGALSRFLDNSIKMTITDVENKYKRIPDRRDGTHDPETNTSVEIEHLALYTEGESPTNSDGIRLHGYFRTNGGYFVVTRVDWYHDYH